MTYDTTYYTPERIERMARALMLSEQAVPEEIKGWEIPVAVRKIEAVLNSSITPMSSSCYRAIRAMIEYNRLEQEAETMLMDERRAARENEER